MTGSGGAAQIADDVTIRRLVIPIYGPAALFSLAEGAVVPIVPILAVQLGASHALAALVVAAVGIGSLTGSIPASLLVARFGERRLIPAAAVVAAMALAGAGLIRASTASSGATPGVGSGPASAQIAAGATSATSTALGLAHPVTWLTIALFLFGMCEALFTMARQNYLTEAVPFERRARTLSTLGGAFRIGRFAGPFLGAAIITWRGIDAVFWMGVVAAVAAGLVSLTLPDAPRSAHHAASARLSPLVVLRDQRYAFATMGVGILLISAVRACRQVALPLWADHLGLTAAIASLVYGIAGGIDLLVFYPAGRHMDRRGRRAVAVPAMAIMAVGFALLPLTRDALWLTLVSCLIGFGNGIGSGIVMTLSADLSPDVGRPQFLGLMRFIAELGNAGGPAVVSLCTVALSLAAGVVAAAAMAAAGAAIMWRYIPITYRRAGTPYR